jgi:PAS domain S-box-containing protein
LAFSGGYRLQKFPAAPAPTWAERGRYVAALIVIAISYFILAKLGLRLASINPSASPIWPPTGLALAAVLLGGLRVWPAIFVGAFAANATTAGTLETSAVLAVGNTLEAVIGGFLITRWSGGTETFASPAGVAKFAALSFAPATVISASVGVVTLYLANLAVWDKLMPIWVTWWLGDVAGALVVTPVIVLWARQIWSAERMRVAEAAETAAVFGLAILVGLASFSPLLPLSEYTSPLGFLAILPLVWAALRRGPRDTATVSLILAAFAVWATTRHVGPFGQLGMNESFLLLLTFMISVTVPSLALSADAGRRHAIENDLRRTQVELDARVKERTAALNDANIHLTEAQRLANLGSWSWDIRENRITWSDELIDIYGVTRETAPSNVEGFVAFLHADDRERVQKSIGRALEGNGIDFSHEERIIRPDGSIRHLQSIGEVVRDESGAPIRMLGICLDVTARREAESALRDSEQNYLFLLKGVRDYAIYMLDAEGRVKSWDEGAARLNGYSAGEIIGRHFEIFLPEEVRAAGLGEQALATAVEHGQFEGQTWLERKDGSRFFASAVMDAIRDDAGKLVGFAALVRDITVQHDAQLALEQTREQLAQSQKMEALGQLTGGIAHDFNNLLMIVSGYAQILQRRLSEAKDVHAVEAIRAAAGRGEKLTRQLLTFSRRQQLTPVVVDVRQRMDAVRDMLAPSLGGTIDFICDVAADVWPVKTDLGELELALVNMAVNARDAMPDGGTITLQARNVVLQPGSSVGSLTGDFVALALIDTGKGIPPDVLARVFEPFFTTKPVGKGTGLGLSQVHGFANQSGGAVTVTSEPGQGTVVTIYLPRTQTDADQAAEEADKEANGAVQGTVLVVEDNRDVAEVTTALLEQIGYRVVRAENAAEALRHLEQGIAFDLMVSDIVMPGAMDGMGLARLCRERFPNLPVLLTSGYSAAALAADGHFDILRKPFELAAFENAIVQTIDKVRRGERRQARAV